METLEVLLTTCAVIVIAVAMILWARYLSGTKNRKSRKQLTEDAKAFEDQIKILNEYPPRVWKLERELWELQNPAEFKLLDEVRFDGAKKDSRFRGVYIVTDVDIESGCSFRRRYQITHKKSGVTKSCIPEGALLKAKS